MGGDTSISQLLNPIVIVGAGRSGTTMMRETLAAHGDLAATEYEMNYLWRHGNAWLSHDMLDPERHYREWKGRYIRRKLGQLLAATGKARLVEKTVANVMRVGYVAKVLPGARIIHVIRDGRAVTSSAMKRWRATPEGSYLASKGLTVPLTDLPVVAARYALGRVRGWGRKRDYGQSWGPRWPGFDADVASLSLAEICAKQWKLSVEAAINQGAALGSEQYLELRYEDIVGDPSGSFERIAAFAGIDGSDPGYRAHIEGAIRNTSVDKWRSHLSPEDIVAVEAVAGDMLKQLGYL